MVGLEKDLKITHGSKDQYAILLATLIKEFVGAEFSRYIHIGIESIGEANICVIEVKPASKPAYYRGEKGSEFYTRLGPTNQMLDPEKSVAYIKDYRK